MNTIITCFEMFAPRLGRTIMHSLWEGAAVAIVLLILLRVLNRASPNLRYLVSCGALSLFMALCGGTFAVLGEGPMQPATAVMIPTVASVKSWVPQETSVRVHALPTMPRTDLMQWIAFAWLVGVCATSLWHFGGWLSIQQMARGKELDSALLLSRLRGQIGVRRAVRLIECARLNVPAVIGVVAPVILIPIGFLNELSPEQVRAIFAHELAHIRRHDYLINLVQAAMESLLFYHPATWWISSRIRAERENCCDDIAASVAEPRMYVSALLALEERAAPRGLPLLAATDGSLLQRVQRLLNPANPPSALPIRSIVAGLIVLACVAVPISIVWHGRVVPPGNHAAKSTPQNNDITGSPILDEDLKPNVLSNRIEPGDLVKLSIGDLTANGSETEKSYRVSNMNGTIDLPYLGQVKIAGLAETEVAQVIGKAYKTGQILSTPRIGFTRIEAIGNTFSIFGQNVDRAGEYQIVDPDTRLSAALAIGGAHPASDQTVVITRKADGGKSRAIDIPAKSLMAGNAREDVVVRPGDVIMLNGSAATTAAPVDSAPGNKDLGEYYIGGTSIKRMGVYSIPHFRITLKQAIIAAGGADSGYIRVLRRDGNAESLLLNNASCEDLVSGKLDDLFLHANDTIIVNLTPLEWHGSTTGQTLKQ